MNSGREREKMKKRERENAEPELKVKEKKKKKNTPLYLCPHGLTPKYTCDGIGYILVNVIVNMVKEWEKEKEK